MARRGENIYKRKDSRWEGRYVIGKKASGKTAFAYIYGKTYTEVKRKLEVCKADRNISKINVQKEGMFRDGTIRAWVEYWLEEEMRPEVKHSTYAVYRGQMERYVLPFVGESSLCKADKQVMELVYHTMIEKNISAATAQNVCKRFLAALRSAQELNLIQTLPSLPYKKKKEVKKKPRFLSTREQKKLERSLDEHKGKDLAVLLSLYSGVRIGECCGFKWKDFDVLSGGIQVSHTVQRVPLYAHGKCKTALCYTEPKSECSERFIPLPEFLMHALNQYKSQSIGNGNEFIFGNRQKAMEPRTLQYYVSSLTNSLGLKGIHFHTLRHTFATRFMEKNGDIQALKEILGHRSAKITLDWYGHSTRQHIQKTMQKLSRLAA